MEAKINTLATIKAFFMPTEDLVAVKRELTTLSPEDRKELLDGIIKIGGELVLVK
jgi:hypothetical protein